MFKSIKQKINSPSSPAQVIHNIGLHVGKRQGWFGGGDTSLFSGEVNANDGHFVIRSQNQVMNGNSMFVRAEGQVEDTGKGSLINLTIKLSKIGIYFLVGTLLAMFGMAIGFVLAGPVFGAEGDATTLPFVMAGCAGYVLLLGLVIRMSIRREFQILDSYIRKQSGAQ